MVESLDVLCRKVRSFPSIIFLLPLGIAPLFRRKRCADDRCMAKTIWPKVCQERSSASEALVMYPS